MTKSETPATERTWRTTVTLTQRPLAMGHAITYEHLGPADYKLDDKENLRVEVYPENSDFEVVIALHLAGTFSAVYQEVLDEEEDEERLEELRAALRGDDPDRLIQVHDTKGDEW